MTEDLVGLASSWRTLDSASSMILDLRSAFSASDMEVGSVEVVVVLVDFDFDFEGVC